MRLRLFSILCGEAVCCVVHGVDNVHGRFGFGVSYVITLRARAVCFVAATAAAAAAAVAAAAASWERWIVLGSVHTTQRDFPGTFVWALCLLVSTLNVILFFGAVPGVCSVAK